MKTNQNILKKSMLCITLSFMILSSSFGQSMENKLKGSWMGELKVQAISLRMVFNISLNDDNEIQATFDSPDQGAKDIPLEEIYIKNDSIFIQSESMKANYKGVLVDDNTMHGFWVQAGMSFPLNLKKQDKKFSYQRSQDPQPPFPYAIKEVKIENEESSLTLTGTLTIPNGEGEFPAVVLVTGSGPQNRDEEVFNHRPFHVIADFLTRNGIAVLRYDDRGVAGSTGSFLNATTFDFADDAEAAFNFLESNPQINKNKIGFIGHSEGALIGMIVAARNVNAAFVVSLGGPSLKGDEVLIAQIEAISKLEGEEDAEIEKSTNWNRERFDILISETNNKKASEMINQAYKDYLNSLDISPQEKNNKYNLFQKSNMPSALDWYRTYIQINPADYISAMDCPLLALLGTKDLHVISAPNEKKYKELFELNSNDHSQVKTFDGVNHFFQHCSTGLPSEYGQIEETISPEVLDFILSWLQNII